MRLSAVFFLYLLFFSHNSLAVTLPTVDEINDKIAATSSQSSAKEIAIYNDTLKWLTLRQEALDKKEAYQNIVDNVDILLRNIRTELNKLSASKINTTNYIKSISPKDLELELLLYQEQALSLSKLVEQEQIVADEVLASITRIVPQIIDAEKAVKKSEAQLTLFKNQIKSSSPLYSEQLMLYQVEIEANKAILSSLKSEQTSISSRQEVTRQRLELLKQQHTIAEDYNRLINQELLTIQQNSAKERLESAINLTERGALPNNVIKEVADENVLLSQTVTQQTVQLKNITTQQLNVNNNIRTVKQTLTTLEELSQWLNLSTTFGQILRSKLSQLPDKTQSKQLDLEIAEINLFRLNYNELLDDLENKRKNLLIINQNEFSAKQLSLFNTQLDEQKELLTTLVNNYDTISIELTKLKAGNHQFSTAIDEVRDKAYRYFFWIADVQPISLSYPLTIIRDINYVLSLDTFSELWLTSLVALKTPGTLLILLCGLAFVFLRFRFQRTYFDFLNRTANKIGKVTLDNFYLTLKTFVFSIIFALPVPILWASIGYALQIEWDNKIAVAFGVGINSASPMLWVFMITASFAHPKGLFLSHFNWNADHVRNAMRYYRLAVWVIIPLVTLLMALQRYGDDNLFSTLGRLFFILICIALIFITQNIYRVNLPLYLDKKGSGDNILNEMLWAILLTAPWLAAIAAMIGYLTTAIVLLNKLETSVFIWFSLLLVYYVIRRWMLIQRRRIEFEQAKQRRAERIAYRHNNKDEPFPYNEGADVSDEPVIDLDTISAQSLKLIRSILSMISLIFIILLWSELYSAFAFLDNITLWSSMGLEGIQRITLASVIIAILAIVITSQFVANLPALLELTILQHMDLMPGTGYAITTLSKYSVLMIGSMITFSFVGVDWSKIQWLIAALGVGLGFGLQEIFANFVSGLILLVEKPIRIGDTVTIRELTGTITKINTRATTLIDWDRKEIIMPNKAFVTEQLVNWSLSDQVTRIVLTIPATIDTDSNLVIEILKAAANKCSYVLKEPASDAFLVDIQNGIQLFELRAFAAEMAHRMPVRNELHQLIIQGYKEHNIELPFPPFQMKLNQRVYSYKEHIAGGV